MRGQGVMLASIAILLILLAVMLFTDGAPEVLTDQPQAEIEEPESPNDEEDSLTESQGVSNGVRGSATAEPTVSGDRQDHGSGVSAAGRNKPAAWSTWEKPAFGMLITGEQHGYFEPCGCSANQLGGMSRRDDLSKTLTSAGWQVFGLDLGGLPRRTGVQAQLKFELTLKALRDMNYKAIGLGPEDLRLKADYLMSQHFTEGSDALPFVSANIVFFDAPELGTPVTHTIFDAGGMRIGVTSVLGESFRKRVLVEGGNSFITVNDPKESIRKVLEVFNENDVTFRILLSQADQAETTELIHAAPEFDMVVAAEGPEDPENTLKWVDQTPVLNVGRKGKHVGVVGIYPGRDQPVQFDLVSLIRDDFNESDRMIAHMAHYQERLRNEAIANIESPIGYPSGATFVGADRCGECHTEAYEIWENSKHGSAFASLNPANKRHGYERLNGIARTFDPECIACHVTGWEPQEIYRFRSGFLNEEFATSESEKSLQAMLANSQCENCHGPGSMHVELAEAGADSDIGDSVRVTLEQAKGSMCYKCHDLDNSPDFDFESYWEDVKH